MHNGHAFYRTTIGFTLVELAVTISIIGILITLSTVAWSSWRHQVAIDVLKNDLTQAASQLKSDLSWNNVYPEHAEDANGGKGLPKSNGTTYDYTYIAGLNQYCLAATSDTAGVPTFFITNQHPTPQEGTCP